MTDQNEQELIPRRRGRPSLVEWTDEEADDVLDQVQTLAARGLTQSAIRAALNIGRRRWDMVGDAFIERFEEEADMGRYKGEAKVADIVFKRALGGDLRAAMFYLTHRCGWTYRQEISGADGAPIKIVVSPDAISVL
jgi:hypothetical protein